MPALSSNKIIDKKEGCQGRFKFIGFVEFIEFFELTQETQETQETN